MLLGTLFRKPNVYFSDWNLGCRAGPSYASQPLRIFVDTPKRSSGPTSDVTN
jgi:hypothetical protein